MVFLALFCNFTYSIYQFVLAHLWTDFQSCHPSMNKLHNACFRCFCGGILQIFPRKLPELFCLQQMNNLFSSFLKLCRFCDWESFASCKICIAMRFAWVQDYGKLKITQSAKLCKAQNHAKC